MNFRVSPHYPLSCTYVKILGNHMTILRKPHTIQKNILQLKLSLPFEIPQKIFFDLLGV
jgi:hypothetical protein